MGLFDQTVIKKVDDPINNYFADILRKRDFSTGTKMFYETETVRDISPELYNRYKAAFNALTPDDPKRLRFLFQDETRSLFYIISMFPISEAADLDDNQMWFYSLCTKDEIRRIFNPENADDFLLKLRAEQVRDNIRLFRVFMSLKRKQGADWSFSNYFDNEYFADYLSWLPYELGEKCKGVAYGSIELTSAEGVCAKGPFGNVILISYALKYYLYYMNAFLFGSHFEIDSELRFRSLILAIRILLGVESVDFMIDDRGGFGEFADKRINEYVTWQLLFIAGHEFAHHYLGHVGTASLIERNLFPKDQVDRVYNYKQVHEFEADKNAILSVHSPIDYCKSELTDAAIRFFAGLELYEFVCNFLSPPIPSQETHPPAVDRLLAIWETCKEHSRNSEEDIQTLLSVLADCKEQLLRDFLPFNTEVFEFFGSVYLTEEIQTASLDRFTFD